MDNTAPVEALGELVARLRRQRGLTQKELGDLAGWNDEVIGRVEQHRGRWSVRTARSVFEALAKKKPMTEQEAHDFLVQSRITESVNGRLYTGEYAELLQRRFIYDPVAHHAPPPTEPSVIPLSTSSLVCALLEHHGADRIDDFLRGLLALSRDSTLPVRHSDPSPPAPLVLKTSTPPRRLSDGTVEQVFSETRIIPAPSHATPSAPTGKIPRPHTGA